jgi:ribosome biogenesis GTPase
VPIDETLEDPSMNAAPAGVGRRPDLDAELAQLGDPDLTAARVLAQHRGRWLVAGGDEPPKLVAARGRLRGAGERAPITGDWVAIDADGVIASVLERRGTIVRRAAGSPVAAQVLAANVELVLVVEPLPEPNERRAERIVALAQAGGVPAALVLTKADLDPEGAAGATAAALARRLGVVDGLAVSVHDEASIAPVAALLEPGSTTVLLGPSGAGKSTLVNALLGFERQATGGLSSAGDRTRGRHTTVTRDLLALPSGALLIDTPGIREAGLWDGGASATFADLEALALRCRFADCAHENEPGCAVREESDPERVDAWLKLEREQAWIEDRRAAALARESAGRSYRRIQRESRRMKGDG